MIYHYTRNLPVYDALGDEIGELTTRIEYEAGFGETPEETNIRVIATVFQVDREASKHVVHTRSLYMWVKAPDWWAAHVEKMAATKQGQRELFGYARKQLRGRAIS